MKIKVIVEDCFCFESNELDYTEYSIIYNKLTELLQKLTDESFNKTPLYIIKEVKLKHNEFTSGYFIEKEYLLKNKEEIKKIIGGCNDSQKYYRCYR